MEYWDNSFEGIFLPDFFLDPLLEKSKLRLQLLCHCSPSPIFRTQLRCLLVLLRTFSRDFSFIVLPVSMRKLTHPTFVSFYLREPSVPFWVVGVIVGVSRVDFLRHTETMGCVFSLPEERLAAANRWVINLESFIKVDLRLLELVYKSGCIFARFAEKKSSTRCIFDVSPVLFVEFTIDIVQSW